LTRKTISGLGLTGEVGECSVPNILAENKCALSIFNGYIRSMATSGVQAESFDNASKGFGLGKLVLSSLLTKSRQRSCFVLLLSSKRSALLLKSHAIY